MLQKELGDKIEVTFLENVPEGPDAERAIEGLAQAGNKLIFTTSFGFMDPTMKVAPKFPDVKFEHATGFKTAPNVTTYNARFYQGRYIIGQIAAKMSKTGIAGYIVSFPIPEVVMGINSFMLGAQSVNPDFKVKIVWINTWMDPAKEGDAAKALFDQGVDIITQHTDSTEPLKIAEERGLHRLRPGARHVSTPRRRRSSPRSSTTGARTTSPASRRSSTAPGSRRRAGTAWPKARSRWRAYTNMPDDVAAAAKDIAGQDHVRRVPSVHRPDLQAGRHRGRRRRRRCMDDGDLLGMN